MAVEFCEHLELPENLQVEDFLGSGAYGTVCSVKVKSTSQSVAVKKCKKVFSSRTLAKRTLREITLLKLMDHPNCIRMLDVLRPVDAQRFDDVYIVFELMEADLSQIIHSTQVLSTEHVQYFAAQIFSALDYLHCGRVVHRDLKLVLLFFSPFLSLYLSKKCDFPLFV